MTPTSEFDLVNQIYGWGDPGSPERPGIWFVGIEEAAGWGKADANEDSAAKDIEWMVDRGKMQIKEHREKYGDEPFIECIEPPESTWVSIPCNTSKIICTLMNRPVPERYYVNPGGHTDTESPWRYYRDNYLWRTGSGICNANLFPLGKPNTRDWPSHYERLFGVAKTDSAEYHKVVKATRFPMLFKYWQDSQPQATICYGKAWLDHFQELFRVRFIEMEDHILYCKEESILLVPHLSRPLSSSKINIICNQLKKWTVVPAGMNADSCPW
jgi:hypothetical protein